MITLGPETARCEVLVFRDGLLSAVAHDLLLRATGFELDLEPGASVVTRVRAASLRVVTALRDGRELPGALRPRDVVDIEATIAGTVLRAARFPEIRFASSAIAAAPDGWQVEGALTLCGVTRALSTSVRRAEGRLVAEVVVHQPAFGIRPYRAMMGTLRVKPDVVVRMSVPAAAAE